jgi:hypothetical protein
VLLVRLLSSAPPCECWSWEVCLAVLQLLVSMEGTASAAGAVLFAGIAAADVETSQQQQEQQQQDVEVASVGPGGTLPPGHIHQLGHVASVRLEDYIGKLLSMLQNLRQADAALAGCHSGSGSRSGRDPPHTQQQQQQAQAQSALSGSRPSSASRSRSRAQQRQQQQQQLEEFSDPNWWRSQALTLYKRKGGYTWLEQFLSDATADNHRPGFWGLVSCVGFGLSM